ncbi:hypothetical protein J1G35_26020 [Pseudomonas sp. SH10-3B]|uniref:hypothetical protein n=1 Tax=Pseudomonas sp. SH10-3B TaxID=2816049 RepID=UPI001CA6AAA3|nr:hypothetical protein [Pseudomonas sp. SH10-3B]MBY8949323.1 hypothetical protein [Pseudomonas sp. SH10-3B]
MSNWEEVEKSVRQYASYIWNRPANADRIGGVNFDCVVKISEIEIIAIEITKNRTLEKIREDIGKIQTIRMAMMMKNIMIRPYNLRLFTYPRNERRRKRKLYRSSFF